MVKISFYMQVKNLRPEFRSGLDALTKFIFERTRPKQVGGTVMTGPIFARITQSYLDALNKGVVPTITSSWQVGLVSILQMCGVAYTLFVVQHGSMSWCESLLSLIASQRTYYIFK